MIALTGATAFLFSAFSFIGKPKKLPPTAAPAPKADTRAAQYYWFIEPGNIYNDENSVSDEILEWWVYYDGVLINTVSEGGTLIAEGFITDANPPRGLPYYFLYAHFNW